MSVLPSVWTMEIDLYYERSKERDLQMTDVSSSNSSLANADGEKVCHARLSHSLWRNTYAYRFSPVWEANDVMTHKSKHECEVKSLSHMIHGTPYYKYLKWCSNEILVCLIWMNCFELWGKLFYTFLKRCVNLDRDSLPAIFDYSRYAWSVTKRNNHFFQLCKLNS